MVVSRLASRARTTTDTNEMLKATWENTSLSMPAVRSTPGMALNSGAVSPKNTSSMTAMVTSGMMIGRYRTASKVFWPHQRKRSSARAAMVPNTTAITVDNRPTLTETQIDCWIPS